MNSDAGFGQIIVLVGLATISAILTVALATAAGNERSSRILFRTVTAEIAADSGVREVLAATGNPADGTEAKLLDGPLAVVVGDATVEVGLEGEGGKIDPLRTDPEVIEGYLDDLGIEGDERTDLLSAVAAARVTEDEDVALVALRKALIDRIPTGVFDSDFSRFGRGAGVDPQYASGRVLRAMPDLSDAAAAGIEERRRDDAASVRALSRYFGPASTIFSIVAYVPGDGGDAFTRRVPIEITTGGRAVPLVGYH